MRRITFFTLLKKEKHWWTMSVCCLLFLLIGPYALAQGYVTVGGQGSQSGNLSTSPANGYYESRRIQIVYTAAEITSAIGAAGNIERLAWDVSAVYAGVGGLPNYTVKMGHITTNNIPTTTYITGLTTVKNPFNYVPALGFNDIIFDTPFTWNGTDNIIIDICFSAAPYTSPYGQVWNYTGVTDNYRSGQSDDLDLCVATTATASQAAKPRVRLYMPQLPPCSVTPQAGTVQGNVNRVVCQGSAPGVITVTGATNPLLVGIAYQWEESTDGGTTWSNVTGGTGANTAIYTPPSFTGTTIQYRLKVSCANDATPAYSDITTISPQIVPVTQVSALVISPSYNTLTLSWTNGSGNRRMALVSTTPIADPVNATGITAPTAATVWAAAGQQVVYDGTGSSVTVTGLTCGTIYYVKVYEYNRCGSGPYDVYYNVTEGTNTTVVTGAATAALPVVNNFTGFTGTNLHTVLPGWYESAIATAAEAVPTTANPLGNGSIWRSASAFGTTTARINLYTNTRNEWIISPKVQLTANSRLTFKAAITAYNNLNAHAAGMQGTDDKVNVLISIDGCGSVWTPLYTFEASNTTTLTNSLQDFNILLSAYTGQTVQIAFQATDGPVDNAPDYDFHIANIVIEEVPACDVPTGLALTGVAPTSASFSWDVPLAGVPTGYEYVVSATNTTPDVAGTAVTGTTATATVLPETTYYIFVRTVCGTATSDWSSSITFTTPCAPVAAPFLQEFGAGTLPNCWTNSSSNTVANGLWKFTGSVDYASGNTRPNGTFAWVDGSDPSTISDVTLTTPFINLSAITVPELVFDMFSNNTNTYPNNIFKVDVYDGTTWTNVYTNNTSLNTWRTISVSLAAYAGSTVQIRFVVDKTAAPVGNAFYNDILLDNVIVQESPTCFPPAGLTVSGVTETSATLTWAAPDTVPSVGYDIYYSTSNVAPDDLTAANGSATGVTTNLTSLISGTRYYVWMRGNCGAIDGNSVWTAMATFATLCDSPEITATTPGSVCGQGTVSLTATSAAGDLYWYDAMTGGTQIGTGSNFTTPSITETTDFYVSSAQVAQGVDVKVGAGAATTATYSNPLYSAWSNNHTQHLITAAELTAAGLSAGNITSIALDVTSAGTLPMIDLSVKIGSSTATEMTAFAANGGFNTVYTNAIYMPTTGINTFYFTTPYNWDGTSNIVVEFCHGNPSSSATMSRTVRSDATDYVSTVKYHVSSATAANTVCGTTTGANLTSYSVRPQFIFNGTGLCHSPRQAVTATVTPAPAIVAAASETSICDGESSDLSVTSINTDYTYVWMPGNLSGAMHTVTPTETTTYTVTATDAVSGCVTAEEVTIVVNVLPAAVTITANNEEVCLGETVSLTATGGNSAIAVEYCTPVIVGYPGAGGDYLNNFTFANITNNNSGDAASDYTYYNNLTANVVADGTTTYNVSLQAGGTSGTYAQQFRIWIDFNQNGIFEASESVFNTTTSSFSPALATGTVTIPNTALNGTTRMRVASRFSSQVGADQSCQIGTSSAGAWGEFEDYNITITGGTNGVEYVWTPITGLYTDAAATIAYTGELTGETVYSKPTSDITYTATSTSIAGCSASASVSIDVTVIPAPVMDAAQTFCGGATIAGFGEGFNAYYSPAGGNAIAADTPMLNNTVYYVSQTVDGCESMARTAVTVTVNTTAAPAAQQDVQTFCNAATLENIDIDGEGILWYTSATGGTALAADAALSEGTEIYYASQTVDGCESSARTAVAVTLNITDAPVAGETQTFCNAATVAGLTAQGTAVQWYADAEGGTALANDTALVNGTMYYVSQTINGCESPRMEVTVVINSTDAPVADATQSFCHSATVAQLIADGTDILWYADAEGGTPLAQDAELVDGITYYGSQVVNECESSDRVAVTVVINTVSVDAPEDVIVCDEYILPALVSGAYYTGENGTGTMLMAGDAINETTTIYVYGESGTVPNCTAENSFLVVINSAAAPTGEETQQIVAESAAEATIEDLVVDAEGTVYWYASMDDMVAGNALPAGTQLVSGATYYAMQMVGDCMSTDWLEVTVDVVLDRKGFDTASFSYYPNPVKDVLNLRYSSEITSVTVYNLLGQQVTVKQLNATEGTVDMSTLADGTYIVNVTAGDNVKTLKVVKKQ